MIYRGNDSDSLTLYDTILGAETTSFKDTEVKEGKTYYYTVRAKNGVGESKSSSVLQIIIPSSPGVPGFSLVMMSIIIGYLATSRLRSNKKNQKKR